MTTTSLKDLRLEVRHHMDRRLAEHRLVRKRADEYVWPLADGFEGWFGLGYISRPEMALIQVDQFVGVRSEAVEAVVQRLGGTRSRGPWRYSVSTQLWNLMPDRGMWLLSLGFAPDQPIDMPAGEILDAFETCGRPWAEARATLPTIRDELAGQKGMFHSGFLMPRRLAAHLLCGDRAAAEADLRAAQEEARKDTYKPEGFRGLVATWTSRFPEVAAFVLDGSG